MAAPQFPDKNEMFALAQQEMEHRVELYNKITHNCFEKCIDKRFKESDLNLGETSCVDRCVNKYFQITNMVGQLLGSGSS